MFSTIDVMVAQAHIDQLNELADTKPLVKADRHGANSGHAGVPRKSADPQGLRTFCILSRTRGTTPPVALDQNIATGLHRCTGRHEARQIC